MFDLDCVVCRPVLISLVVFAALHSVAVSAVESPSLIGTADCGNEIRRLVGSETLVEEMLKIERAFWGDLAATPKQLRSRLELFPEGQFIARDAQGRLLGFLNTQRIFRNDYGRLTFKYHFLKRPLPSDSDLWSDFTDNGTIVKSHKAQGQYLFFFNFTIDPDIEMSRRLAIGTALVDAARNYANKHSVRAIFGLTRSRAFHVNLGALRLMRVDSAFANPNEDLQWGDLIVYLIPNGE